MKKHLLLLLLLTTITLGVTAQTNGHVSIHASSYPIGKLTNRMTYSEIYIHDNGVIAYFRGGAYHIIADKKGTYYINNGTIYITWENGHKETAKLTYTSNGNAIVTYNNIKMYEKYAEGY